MTSIDWGMAGFSYRERTGEFCFNGINGSIAHNDFFVYNNGKVRHIGSAEHASYAGVGGTTEEFSTMDNSSVDEATYNTYIESFGEYESYVSCTYTDIYEAYRNFRVIE